MPPRIGRLTLALVAASLVASFACSHPTGSGSTPGTGGNVGSPGSAGATGSAGNGGPGTAGNSGSAGNTGSPGSGGNVSTPGTAGDTGSAGNTGAAGDTGTPGTAGNVGSPGAAGSGNPGTAGAAGGGSAGDTGSAGNTGSAGAAGGNTGSGGSGTPANNLIVNGDFSNGATNWHVQDGTGNVNGSGAYCVSNPGAALIGWEGTPGSLLMLRMGTSYRLSYQASGSGTVNVKIGLAVSPYTSDFEGSNSLNSSLQTFTHTFTCPNNNINTGMAFTFSNAGSSTVCIDNVSLVPN
jgi:hypothetical protein